MLKMRIFPIDVAINQSRSSRHFFAQTIAKLIDTTFSYLSFILKKNKTDLYFLFQISMFSCFSKTYFFANEDRNTLRTNI